MKFVKTVICLLLIIGMSACSTKKTDTLRILSPMGATSLSLLGLYGDEKMQIDTVDGSDVLTAELSKDNSAYDMIIAPINLGVKLMEKNDNAYVLHSIVTWGNLFIVGKENALQEEGVLAAFGEMAVPQKVFEASFALESIKPSITYFASANEVMQQLLTQKAQVGLLAEPAASATVAKAKEKGIQLQVLADVQDVYQKKQGTKRKGYPQAALFVKKGSEKRVAKAIEKATTFVTDTVKSEKDAIQKQIAIATVEKLGIPNANIAQTTWDRQNIQITPAKDVKDEIALFLNEFKIEVKDEYYAEYK